jgi:hypothetical protein
MKILDLPPCLKSATIVFLISLCLVYPGYAEEPTVYVTLEWDKSIDDPYIQSYKVYYYTTSGNKDSLKSPDYVKSCSVAKGDCLVNQGPITINKENQFILIELYLSKFYYFVVSSVEMRNGVPIEGETTPEISMMKGDIDANGIISLDDAILVFQLMSRRYPQRIVRVADVNSDGKLGVEDAIYILQKVAGLRGN